MPNVPPQTIISNNSVLEILFKHGPKSLETTSGGGPDPAKRVSQMKKDNVRKMHDKYL